MPSNREITETVRSVLAGFGGHGINSGVMAAALAAVLEKYGDKRDPEELRELILVEAAHLGVRAVDAPH